MVPGGRAARVTLDSEADDTTEGLSVPIMPAAHRHKARKGTFRMATLQIGPRLQRGACIFKSNSRLSRPSITLDSAAVDNVRGGGTVPRRKPCAGSAPG